MSPGVGALVGIVGGTGIVAASTLALSEKRVGLEGIKA